MAEFELGGLAVTQETLLWDGEQRVVFRTHVDGSAGQDRLLRVRFPADVPGGLPVYQTATAVIGRPFGHPGIDTAEHWFTLDNPAHDWFGVGSTARVALTGPDGTRLTQAIGVAEVITPVSGEPSREAVRALIAALAAAGVTATCSRGDGPRYGALDADSNLPDVRITLGGPEDNPFTAAALSAAGSAYAKELGSRLEAGGPARLWLPSARSRSETFVPSADLRGAADLPVLVVAGAAPGAAPARLTAAVAALAGDLADAVVEVPAADIADRVADSDAPLAGHCVALLNRGTPGCAVSTDGTLHLSLMRACSSWPAGVWIDGDKRAAPDGSSFAWQHWSHTYEYALAAGTGDWRTAGFTAAASDYNHDLITCEGGGPAAPLAPGVSLVSVDHPAVVLCALKPHGNPLASGRPGLPAAAGGLTVRLRETEGRPARAQAPAARRGRGGAPDRPAGRARPGPAAGAGRRGGRRRAAVRHRDRGAPAGRAAGHRAGHRAAGAGREHEPAGRNGRPGRDAGRPAGARPARVHAVLAARQGPGPGREPAGRGAHLAAADRAAAQRPGRRGRPGQRRHPGQRGRPGGGPGGTAGRPRRRCGSRWRAVPSRPRARCGCSSRRS